MSPKRPEFADCLASPSPRTRGLAMPILGFLLCGQLTGCFLIPTVAVSDCVCDMGQICNADKVCQNGVDEPPPSPQDAACIYNHDCDGSVCEYNSADIMANRCLSMDMLVFVGDPSNCNNVTADGTRQNPYCTINKAIDVVTTSGSGQAIRLLADVNYGSLDSSKFTGKSLTIYGPYEPRPNVNPMMANINLSGSPAVRLSGDNTALTLDGVSVSATDMLTEGAIYCEKLGQIAIKRVLVLNSNVWGVSAKGCQRIEIDRTQFYRNFGALLIDSESLYGIKDALVTNSIFANNEKRSDGYSTISISSNNVLFSHVTVFGNSSIGGGAFWGGKKSVQPFKVMNSIVVNNTLSSGRAQFSPVPPAGDLFVIQDVVLGSTTQNLPTGTGFRLLVPAFTDTSTMNFSLDPNQLSQNRACCLEQVPKFKDVGIDIYGAARRNMTALGAVGR